MSQSPIYERLRRPVAQERLSKERWMPPWVRHQHRARYEWAAALVRGRVVADVACGGGGGIIAMALAGAKRVDGFDFSDEALREARAECSRVAPRIGVLALAEATCLPVKESEYDDFVSLETIEHLADPHTFLAEVVRALKPGGRFLCSTPNRALTNPAQPIEGQPFNPFHVREYTACEFESLLRGFFPVIGLWGQTFVREEYALLLERIARKQPVLAVRLHQIGKLLQAPFDSARNHLPGPLQPGFVPEFLLAVCTKGP